MTRRIDLNADLGEGGSHDARLIALASSVNIACGGHAGDETTILRAIELADAAGAAIGAHPSYEDPANFGRQPLALPATEVRALIQRQLERFLSCAHAQGAAVHHVKPHGALYLQACLDPQLAMVIAREVSTLLPGTALYAPHGSQLAQAAASCGLRPVAEGFADRRYQPDATLVPRNQPGAVIDDPQAARAQALRIAIHQEVLDLHGHAVPLPAETLCVHGDGPHALELLAAIRQELEAAGTLIGPP